MPKATDADIAKIKADNPGVEIFLVEHPTLPHDFLVRGPGSQLWDLYRGKISNDAEKIYADAMLFAGCVLWPPPGKERDELVERYPGLVNAVAGEVGEITGATKLAKHRKV